MNVADARYLGHGFVGATVMLGHCNPALHALVGILQVSQGQVPNAIGVTRGRVCQYISLLDPIPYDRRKNIVDVLMNALDALDESLAFAKSPEGKKTLSPERNQSHTTNTQACGGLTDSAQ